MVHLSVTMYCNWPTDHAIDHSSIGLKTLTIQLMFNEVSLFTFSKETHGFDVTVPKNYLKAREEVHMCFIALIELCSQPGKCDLNQWRIQGFPDGGTPT